MGFDVTFHTISEQQLRRFVYDVVDNPTLAEARASEITPDPKKADEVLNIYRTLDAALREAEAGQEALSEASFSYVVAAIAGYLHPYWYSRNAYLSIIADLLPDFRALFLPHSKGPCARLAHLTNKNHALIPANYCASGLVRDIDSLAWWLRLMEEPQVKRKGVLGIGRVMAPPVIDKVFGKDEKESLWLAVNYATERKLLFMEAADLVVPIEDACYTDRGHLRAHFLDNIAPSPKGPGPAQRRS